MLSDLIHRELELFAVLEKHKDEQVTIVISFDGVDSVNVWLPVFSLWSPRVLVVLFTAFRGC